MRGIRHRDLVIIGLVVGTIIGPVVCVETHVNLVEHHSQDPRPGVVKDSMSPRKRPARRRSAGDHQNNPIHQGGEDHGIGDQEIRIFVETPTHLSDKQKELLNQFAALSGEAVNPISGSFVEKMKGLFKK